MMNRRYNLFRYILLSLLLLPCVAVAQNVTDVRFYQNGKNVVVEYHLDLETDISLHFSRNKNTPYRTLIKNVSGDVGKNVKAGDNTIIWQPLLTEEELIGEDFAFKVVAKKRHVFNMTYLLHTIPMQPMQPILGLTFAINPYGKWYGWYASTTHSLYSQKGYDGWHGDNWNERGDDKFNGNVHVSFHCYATGPIINIKNIVKIHLGINYGESTTFWQTYNNQLIRLDDTGFEQFGIDAGVLLNLHGVTLSVGIASLSNDIYTKFGIGFTTQSQKKH